MNLIEDSLLTGLPPAARLALSWAKRADRGVFAALLCLDHDLSQIVARANEPLPAQLRLAWWRDELGKPPNLRTQGNPLLAVITASWSEECRDLIELVDGWETLLSEPPLGPQALEHFAAGRETAWRGLASELGLSEHMPSVRGAARVWALVDLAGHMRDPTTCAAALELAAHCASETRPQLPRRMRPLTILSGLSRRALGRNDPALLGDRLSPFAALRLGIFGR